MLQVSPRNSVASIIGLQEVVHKQLLDVEKLLPDYAFLGVGRDDGKTRGEHSPLYSLTPFTHPTDLYCPDSDDSFNRCMALVS